MNIKKKKNQDKIWMWLLLNSLFNEKEKKEKKETILR